MTETIPPSMNQLTGLEVTRIVGDHVLLKLSVQNRTAGMLVKQTIELWVPMERALALSGQIEDARTTHERH